MSKSGVFYKWYDEQFKRIVYARELPNDLPNRTVTRLDPNEWEEASCGCVQSSERSASVYHLITCRQCMWTPLMFNCSEITASVHALSELLKQHEHLYTINAISFEGMSALTYACRAGSLEKVKLLMAAGANPNYRHNPKQMTPLHAVLAEYRSGFSYCTDLVNTLLINGADPDMSWQPEEYEFRITALQQVLHKTTAREWHLGGDEILACVAKYSHLTCYRDNEENHCALFDFLASNQLRCEEVIGEVIDILVDAGLDIRWRAFKTGLLHYAIRKCKNSANYLIHTLLERPETLPTHSIHLLEEIYRRICAMDAVALTFGKSTECIFKGKHVAYTFICSLSKTTPRNVDLEWLVYDMIRWALDKVHSREMAVGVLRAIKETGLDMAGPVWAMYCKRDVSEDIGLLAFEVFFNNERDCLSEASIASFRWISAFGYDSVKQKAIELFKIAWIKRRNQYKQFILCLQRHKQAGQYVFFSKDMKYMLRKAMLLGPYK